MSWVEAALAKGTELASRELEGEPQQAAVAALHELGAASGPIERIGKRRLRAAVALVSAGDPESARLIFLRTQATYEERREASRQSVEEHRRQRELIERDWELFWEAAGKATLKGLRLAAPFLLAAVGI